MTYKVCEHCKRIIAELILTEALAPLGTVHEKRRNCPVCNKKEEVK